MSALTSDAGVSDAGAVDNLAFRTVIGTIPPEPEVQYPSTVDVMPLEYVAGKELSAIGIVFDHRQNMSTTAIADNLCDLWYTRVSEKGDQKMMELLLGALNISQLDNSALGVVAWQGKKLYVAVEVHFPGEHQLRSIRPYELGPGAINLVQDSDHPFNPTHVQIWGSDAVIDGSNIDWVPGARVYRDTHGKRYIQVDLGWC
jgi:hypothetical protein